MHTFFPILMILCALVFVTSITLLIRNNNVLEYRSSLLEKVGKLARQDIVEGKEWMWRYDVFDSVDYSKMVHQFWKRLDAFYPDKSFLNENVISSDIISVN